MTIEELQSKIETLETELSEIKQELEQREVKTGRWKPDDGECYFYINDYGEVRENHWINNAIDKMRFRIGNVFESSKEAKFQVERLKVVAELKEYSRDFRFAKARDFVKFTNDGNNWGIFWNYVSDEIAYVWGIIHQYPMLYFPSKEVAKQAIEAIGEERVKKYYLEVE